MILVVKKGVRFNNDPSVDTAKIVCFDQVSQSIASSNLQAKQTKQESKEVVEHSKQQNLAS